MRGEEGRVNLDIWQVRYMASLWVTAQGNELGSLDFLYEME